MPQRSGKINRPPSFGIYLHVPFCVAKCRYCGFYSEPDGRSSMGRYLKALKQEVEVWSAVVPEHTVTSVFLGGGTPSLLAPEELAELLALLRGRFAFTRSAEISLEANPGTVDGPGLRAIREAGVTRLSLGIQSLDPALLQRMGRAHTPGEARAAAWAARDAGFVSVSFDLLYGLPGISTDHWRRTLGEVLSWRPDHLSLYELTYEPGTPLWRERRRKRGAGDGDPGPDEEDLLRQMRAGEEICAQGGLARYEVSNYARPGHRCRHNLAIWLGGDYAGLGPGAHSFLGAPGWGRRAARSRDLEQYLARECSSLPAWEGRTLEDALAETILCGLRTELGVSVDTLGRIHRAPPPEPLLAEAARLADAGLLELTGRRVRATPTGLAILDAVTARLIGTLIGAAPGPSLPTSPD